MLTERYLVINKNVVIDTKPGLLPESPNPQNLQSIKAYLKLIPYRLHTPQVYGFLPLATEILLLERPPILVDTTPTQVRLCSQFTAAWSDASSIRQLNWLWQIANLWQPLSSEGVGSSLLNPYLLRVEGPLVRLLELEFNSPTQGLPQLGEFWQILGENSKPAIAQFVTQVSKALINREITSPDELITVLDQGLAELGRSQTTTIKIITKTDTGPSRQRNEDACYPFSGTLVSKPPQKIALAIVCDGIGGHEGGNVASNLAIDTIQKSVKELAAVSYENVSPSMLLNDLESSVAVANNKISQRNDNENRQGRQRMGTTLVMALPIAHEMYITHVGDSRAYWITRHGCYQVTLDDDVASREVRLGYTIYRDALQQSGSGSLVQALGMSPSNTLHPTCQRWTTDEDAVFLLTSDGLTDFDRVEEYWETEILPILTEETTKLENVAQRLIEIANTKNGHDNVTIGLIHCQVKYSEPKSPISEEILINTTSNLKPLSASETVLQEKTRVLPETQTRKVSPLPLNFVVPLVFVTASGLLGYWVMKLRSSGTTQPQISASPTATPDTQDLEVGSVIRTKKKIVLTNEKLPFLPPSTWFVTKKDPSSKSGDDGYLLTLQQCPQVAASQQIILSQNQIYRYKFFLLPPNKPNSCDEQPVGPTDQRNTSSSDPDSR
jgi:protein phosphatase